MKVRRKRIFRSPFMLAAISGGTAIVLDFLWSLSEVLKHLNIADIVFATHILLLTLFPVCFIFLMVACKKYFSNGYMRKENTQEFKYKQHIRRQKRLKKVIK